jgi:hypothetical protein
VHALIYSLPFVPLSQAANFHWKFFSPGTGEKSVGEDATVASVGDWTCFLSRIHPIGPFGGELRALECSVGKEGLKAGVTASCEPTKKGGKPTVNSGVLSLEQSKGDPNDIIGANARSLVVMLKCY